MSDRFCRWQRTGRAVLLVVSLCVTGCRSSAGLPAPAPSTTPGVRSVNHLGTPQFALAGPDGEILFTDEGARAILRLDPESGGTTVLSRAGARGRGPAFTFPSGIARNGEGRLFVVDPDRVAVFAVNADNGDRTILSGGKAGRGPPFVDPFSIAVLPDGALAVGDSGNGGIIRVDAHSGDRTWLVHPDGGLAEPYGLVFGEGALYVADSGLHAVLRVDPRDGAVETVSGGGRGDGPALVAPYGIALSEGRLLVTDARKASVIAVDPASGTRSLLSGAGAGSGAVLHEPHGLLERDNHVLVLDSGGAQILEVAMADGARRVLVDANETDNKMTLSPGALAFTREGDLLVVDPTMYAVVRVHLASGKWEIVSQAGTRGEGPELQSPTGVAVAADGAIYVVDEELDGVVRVDSRSGNRSLVSVGGVRGSGPAFRIPAFVAVEPGGRTLAVTDEGRHAVLRVDVKSGDRTILSAAGSKGRGRPLATPAGLACAADGSLYLLDDQAQRLFRIHPRSGDRTVISGTGVGSGPPFSYPYGIALEGARHAIVTDDRLACVFRVDLQSGRRALLSGQGRGLGPRFSDPVAVSVSPRGDIVVADEGLETVVRVHRRSGLRAPVRPPTIARQIGPSEGDAAPSEGHFYIADTANHRIIRMDALDGSGRVALGRQGSGVGQFNRPTHVTVDVKGRIYVADCGNRRIVRMDDMSGRGWVSFSGRGVFRDPLRIVVHPESLAIFVADFGANRVVQLSDMRGSSVRYYEDGTGLIDMPSAVALDRLGRLYVSNDESLRMVRISDPDDLRGESWEIYDGADIPGPFPGLRGMGSVTVAPSGDVYLTDMSGDRIVRLDANLANPVCFGVRGSGPGEFYEPRDVTIDGSGRPVVVDGRNHRLVRFDDMQGGGWVAWGEQGAGTAQLNSPWSCTWSGALLREIQGTAPIPKPVPGRVQVYGRGALPEKVTQDRAMIGSSLRRNPRMGRSQRELEAEDESDSGSDEPEVEEPESDPDPVRPTPTPTPGKAVAHAAPAWLRPGEYLVVADTYNDRLVFLSRNGQKLRFQALHQGPDGSRLSEPSGLAVDKEGCLLVADTENRRIVRMRDPGGRGWTSFRGRGDQTFSQPSGLAVDPKSGRIYVSDPNRNRVLRIDDMQGRGWRAFSDGGQLFRMPEGLAFDAQARLLAVTTDGDYALFRQPSHDDARVRSWRRYTAQDVRPLPGFRDLSSVAVDAGGFIYVTDPTNDRVVRINPDLSGGTPFGTFGQEGRHFFVPLGLTVAHDGHVVVVDCGNHRVVAFKPEASKWNFPASWWSLGHAGPGEFEFLAPTFVTLWRPRGE